MSVYEGAVFVMRATAWYCVLSISQPYMISCLNAEGSVLDIEPSMMHGVFVEGSGLRNGIFHDFGLQRGWFRPTACSAQQLRANTRERGYCRRWLWTGFADRAPGPGYAPMLSAKRRKKLQIAITAACSLNKVMVVSFTK